MRRLLIAALAATALAAAPTAIAAPASDATIAHIAACTKAKIGGQSKCIAPGQFCARAHQSDYKRYGFSCSKRDKNGRYRLA